MDKEKEIIKEIDSLRKDYASELEDTEEEQFSLIDRVNKLIKLIFNDSNEDVYTTLNPEALEKWKKSKVKRWVKKLLSEFKIRNFLYFLLLIIITIFLVSEALPFYADNGIIEFKTYVKAILTEICFLFLAGFVTSARGLTIAVTLLRVAIFCLMLFVITSEVMMRGTEDISKINNLSSRVSRLEKQIESTERDVERFRLIKWPKNMTTSIRKKETLEKELHMLRERQEKEGASIELTSLLKYKIFGKAVFRLILMFISVLITRRLYKF